MTSQETIQELSSAQQIAEHVCRMLQSSMQYPEFAPGSVPIPVVAKAYGKDADWDNYWMASDWASHAKRTVSYRHKPDGFAVWQN